MMNVKSLNHTTKCEKVLSQLRKLKAGIVFLQERHLRTFDHFQLRGGWIGQLYHSNFHSKFRGVALVTKKNIPFVMSKVETDSSGCYIFVVGRLYNTPVVLANVYTPHDNYFFYKFLCSYPKHGHTLSFPRREYELYIINYSGS